MWYVVIPSTEEQFFHESAPEGIDSMKALITAVANHSDVLNPVTIFNSTPRKGEARIELRNLAAEVSIPRTKAYPAVQEMLKEMK
jgi:hypothetical protein